MTRNAWALSLAGLVLLALARQAPATPWGRDAAPGPQVVAQADRAARAASDAGRLVDEQAARLQAALGATRPFIRPARNPFSFHKPEPRAERSAAAASVAVAPTPPVPDRPPTLWPTLVAIIADASAAPTAMLSCDGETAILAVGATFVRFRVDAITADTVQLVDLSSATGARQILSIR